MTSRAHSVPNAERFQVCFVCTGNICRSPIAAQVLRASLAGTELAELVQVRSAGTGPWHAGESADDRAVALLAARGYPTEHVARQLDESDLDADLLVALDSGHERALRRFVDGHGSTAPVRLLRSFDPAATGADVPDPYYGDGADFAAVLAVVEDAMPGLLAFLRDRIAERH